MPEGDTIHYAANRIRPVLAGHVPELDDAAPALRPRPLAGEARRPCRDRGRRPRQAPVPALRGRPADPLPPAHDRVLAGASPRPALAARAAAGLARAAPRRDGGRAVRRAGARADDRVARALRPAHRRPRPGRAGRASSTTTPSCGACARTTRRGRSATRCSTSARSPASATCGRSRAASRRESIPGGRPGGSATPRRWRSSTPAGRGCSARPATATRRASSASTAAPACRARAAAARRGSAPAASGTTTGRRSGARSVRPDRRAPAAAARGAQGRGAARSRQLDAPPSTPRWPPAWT